MDHYISHCLVLAILGTVPFCSLGIKDGLQTQWAIAQTRQANANRAAWQVALSPQATIWRNSGGSLTGKLVKFEQNSLTVAAGGDSETVPLTEVKSVQFTPQDEIWITLPDGTRGKFIRDIRSISIPIEEVPTLAFKIVNTNDSVILNLDKVLNDKEFGKLTSDPDKFYVLKTIEMTASQKVTIYLRAYGSQE